jgi:molecular chaperone IbpA
VVNAYRISVAVMASLVVTSRLRRGEYADDRGEKRTNDEEKVGGCSTGASPRGRRRSFQLADYVQVKGASLENGLLHVDLVREVQRR